MTDMHAVGRLMHNGKKREAIRKANGSIYSKELVHHK